MINELRWADSTWFALAVLKEAVPAHRLNAMRKDIEVSLILLRPLQRYDLIDDNCFQPRRTRLGEFIVCFANEFDGLAPLSETVLRAKAMLAEADARVSTTC